MRTRMTGFLAAWTALFLSAPVALLADVSSTDNTNKTSAAVNAAVENNSDEVFAADLRAVEDLLKGRSRDKGEETAGSGGYLIEELESAKRFFDFAKKELLPHTAAMMGKMQNPDGMISHGQKLLSEEPGSWQGYDFMASGHFRKLEVDEAMKGFEKAIESAPALQKDWYRFMLATCYRMKEDQERAYNIYERIIAAKDNWIAVKSSYLGAGMVLLHLGDDKNADYIDKGIMLSTPDERASLLAAGVCKRFAGAKKLPSACVVNSSLRSE